MLFTVEYNTEIQQNHIKIKISVLSKPVVKQCSKVQVDD